jgi:hypothetical protein
MANKIGFYGDSFCADWGEGCWTTILCERLGIDEPVSLGIQGANCWTYFKKLCETIDQVDIVIVCHTQEDRVPNAVDAPLHQYTVEHIDDYPKQIEKYGLSVWTAARQFYRHLYDPSAQRFFYRAVVREISEITKGKKVIHVFGFDSGPYRDLVNGVTIIPSLLDISVNEKSIDQKGMWDDQRLNHLNEHNNKELAHQLHLILEQYDELDNNIAQLNLNRFDFGK